MNTIKDVCRINEVRVRVCPVTCGKCLGERKIRANIMNQEEANHFVDLFY